MGSFSYFIERMLQLFILYIIFLTTISAMESGYERDMYKKAEFPNYDRSSKQRYDQILSNLHSLFEERASDSEESSESVEDTNNLNYNYNKRDKRQFNEVLSEVTGALDKIKEELIKFNNDELLTVDAVKHERRYKRDVTNETDTNTTSTENNVTVMVTTTERPVAVTEKVIAKNETVKTEVLRSKNAINDTAVNGRRMISMMAVPPQYVAKTSKVKDKLLSYLEDTFDEVERKIKPLTNIKIALSNDDHYRIGYIIATIDTLEVNLKKLRNDMNLHQHIWDDEKVLDLFDRIKATNTVATSLIDTLKNYLPRK